MSFLFMRGLVRNVLVTPEGQTRDGKEYGGKDQIQLEVDQALRNGHHKLDIITLNTNHPDRFTEGEIAEVPVGYFVRNNAVIFFEAEEAAAGRASRA